MPPPATPSYALLPGDTKIDISAASPPPVLTSRRSPADGDSFCCALMRIWPATLDAFNGTAVAMYVVCTLALAYYAHVGGPDVWVLCLLIYWVLVVMVTLLTLTGMIRSGDPRLQRA